MEKIPEYPLFRSITLQDKDLFDEYFRVDPPEISEFTFTNIYSWKDKYGFEVSYLTGFLLLRSKQLGDHYYFEPIGGGDKAETIMDVLESEHAGFIRVSEGTAHIFHGIRGVDVKDDPDNYDYIYRTEDLAKLEGKRYDGKRNHIKRFKDTFDYEYVNIDERDTEECLDFADTWCGIKKCDLDEGLSSEKRAYQEMVKNMRLFSLYGGAIRIGGKISALAFGEKLNDDTMVMHVQKAYPGPQGLYQVINNEFAKANLNKCSYINMEQDLGISGIRKAKSSYHPDKMIKKYKVSKS